MGIFNIDNKFFRALNKLVDMVILSFLLDHIMHTCFYNRSGIHSTLRYIAPCHPSR